jgi:hypothetical protein
MSALEQLAGALPEERPFDHRLPQPRAELRFLPRD